jgi:hypothetical protein
VKIARTLALAFVGVLVLAMLVLTASVFVGAITAGNLWLLLPLALYAYAFFVLSRACTSGDEVARLSQEIRKIDEEISKLGTGKEYE